METGVPRLDLTAALEPPRVYKKMDPAVKQMAVDKLEGNIRTDAWQAARLNPLIGSDTLSCEPIWDKERNVL
jgi:hypothetical protein